MSYDNRFPDWKEKIIEAANVAKSATEAASILGIKFTTYKKYAQKYNCYKADIPGRNVRPRISIPLEEILDGLHPSYQSNKLRIRLIKEGVLEAKCNNCNLSEWLGNPIPLELEHIDGVHSNHSWDNIELLCPNCHALTETYRGKNKGFNEEQRVEDN